jgi:hypothetical protein
METIRVHLRVLGEHAAHLWCLWLLFVAVGTVQAEASPSQEERK